MQYYFKFVTYVKRYIWVSSCKFNKKSKKFINRPYSNTLNLDIDDCVTIPCQNGGSCTDQVNSYTCNCADGYDGTNCETGNDATFFQICYKYQNMCMIILM